MLSPHISTRHRRFFLAIVAWMSTWLCAVSPATGSSAVLYDLPLHEPAPVIQPFLAPAQPWLPGHRGVDLGATDGQIVLASADGIVAFAGTVVNRPVISIDHADGIRTTYEPVDPLVHAGQRVRRGETLGILLPGHRHDGVTVLHWGARRGKSTYINPLYLIHPPAIVLKPLGFNE